MNSETKPAPHWIAFELLIQEDADKRLYGYIVRNQNFLPDKPDETACYVLHGDTIYEFEGDDFSEFAKRLYGTLLAAMEARDRELLELRARMSGEKPKAP